MWISCELFQGIGFPIFANMNPKLIEIKDFTYELPDEKVAYYPLAERDQSKLLVYKAGKISEDIFTNAASLLPTETLLVFNNTKVVEARLKLQKDTGTTIEIFCLEPIHLDITNAMQAKRSTQWKCFVGGAKKWKSSFLIKKLNGYELNATMIEKLSDAFIIQFIWNADKTFAEVLHEAGAIPLPPYIKRDASKEDETRYQTVYAKHEGSVAAPTAGLHFSEKVLNEIAAKNIQTTNVTLHVGAGTFKPVSADKIEDHEMHAEYIDVTTETIQTVLNSLDKNIVCVGTTSMRTIESLYWLGTLVYNDANITSESLTVSQWLPYEVEKEKPPVENALTALLNWIEKNNSERIITKTSIIIAPGYEFKIVKGLFTNFHQPQSTLLLLVAAFIGADWKNVYDYALKNNFRFLSYGDGSLLWRNDHH
jgi:S-adenosylmethionine:tRNA ribosyltransferase-isomerase